MPRQQRMKETENTEKRQTKREKEVRKSQEQKADNRCKTKADGKLVEWGVVYYLQKSEGDCHGVTDLDIAAGTEALMGVIFRKPTRSSKVTSPLHPSPRKVPSKSVELSNEACTVLAT